MRPPAELSVLFRARGLKVTAQRECIFDVVYANATHPTAEAVYQEARTRLPHMSLKTVYQTLNDLAEMGEIQMLSLGPGSSRFDPNVGDHHHLVCVRCGDVRDVHVETASLTLPAEAQDGFDVRATDVVFRGLCAACRPGAAPASSQMAQPHLNEPQ